MPAKIIDGTKVAAEIRSEAAVIVREVAGAWGRPRLVAVMVGDASAARAYAASQRKQCDLVGIEYRLQELRAETSAVDLCGQIDALNADRAVRGIMVHLPLPAGIDPAEIQLRIDRHKDVEGVNPANIGMMFYGEPVIAPCTALAVMALLRESGVRIEGAEAVVVGHSNIAGKPVGLLLLNEMATVTVCHVATRELAGHTRRADILVVAVGKAGLIGPGMVKPGAVVIDVGINRVREVDGQGKPQERIVGDVAFEAVREVAGAISPVPGGVGAVTTAVLLRNTAEAARRQVVRMRQ
jgi:methylenetetrahydrofolate dehydrogenase (NADP+)/methenyltetrahydrofolate cyclohydrolase